MPLPLSFDIVVDIFYERSHYVACNVSRMFLVNFLLRCTFPNHLLLPLPPPPLPPPPFLPPFLPPVPPPPSSIETRCKWVFVECVVEIPRTKLSFAFVVCYVLFVCLLLLSFLIKKLFFRNSFHIFIHFLIRFFIFLYF